MQKMNIDKAEKTLGLSGEYGEAELKAAYRKMISEYHPDKFATQPDTMKQLAAEKLQDINEAYNVLRKLVSNGMRMIAGTSYSPDFENNYSSRVLKYRTSADSYDPFDDYIPTYNSNYTDPYEPAAPRKAFWKRVIIVTILLFFFTQTVSCITTAYFQKQNQITQSESYNQYAEIVDYGFVLISNDKTSFATEIKNNHPEYILTSAKVKVTFYDITGNEIYSDVYKTYGVALPGETVLAGDEPPIANVAKMECELLENSVTYNLNENNEYKTPLSVTDVVLRTVNDSGTEREFIGTVENPNNASFTKAIVMIAYRDADGHPVYLHIVALNGNWQPYSSDKFIKNPLKIASPPTGRWDHYTIQATPDV